MTFVCVLVDTGILQNSGKYLAGLLHEDIHGIVGGEAILFLQLGDPGSMLAENFISGDIRSGYDSLCQCSQLTLQTAGKNCQTHYLNEADVLLLDVVLVCMGMEHTQSRCGIHSCG